MRIDRERAVEIARVAAAREGHEWWEPIRVNRGWFRFTVWTNADHIGGNLIITVDRRTGHARVVGPTPK